MAACLACGAESARRFTAREMMFGTGDPFDYRECARCGSLQIVAVPTDLARYYAGAYYSFAVPRRWLTRYLRGRRAAAALGWGGWVGRALIRRYGVPADLRAVVDTGLAADAAVLDVGCGSGALLLDLRAAGFSRVAGVDPFVARTIRYPNGVTVWRRTLAEHDGHYALVMMHHSLEHMADPLGALREARRLLDPGGLLVVRVPVASTYAWRTYGAHWVQLDAPRHIFIPSDHGLRVLAHRAGFVVDRVAYDSDAFQFWGSELYRRKLSLTDARGRHRGPSAAGYSAAQTAELAEPARMLNEAGDGDQACFYLRSARAVEGVPLDQPKS